MVKKWFACGTVTALGCVVALAAAAGCSSDEDLVSQTDPTQSEGDAGAKKPPKRDPQPPPPEEPVVDDWCKDESAKFTPAETKPTAKASTSACTAAVIDALADACLGNPASEECKAARQRFQNKTCAECIFTESASEPEWKVFIIDPPTFNQRGCMDHVTGVQDCGRDLANLIFIPGGCLHTYCGTCSEADTQLCYDDVLQNECSPHLLTQECANAWQKNNAAVANTCFGDANIADQAEQQKDLFVKMAKAACMASGTGNKDGG